MKNNRRNPEPFATLIHAVAESKARGTDLWVKITGNQSSIQPGTIFHVYPGGRVVQSAKMKMESDCRK